MQQEWITMRAFFNQLVELPDDVWEAVLRVAHPAQYLRKQVILQPGQLCDRMIFLHRGAIRAYRLLEGLDITYFFYFPDEFAFATEFASFKTNQPTQFYLECIDDCQATVFYHSDS